MDKPRKSDRNIANKRKREVRFVRQKREESDRRRFFYVLVPLSFFLAPAAFVV